MSPNGQRTLPSKRPKPTFRWDDARPRRRRPARGECRHVFSFRCARLCTHCMYFHSVLHCTSIWVFVPALTNEEMEVKLPDSVACSDLCLSTQHAYSRSRLQICLSTQHASGFHPYTPKTPIVLLLPPPYFTEMGYIYIAVEKIVFIYVTVKISKYLSTYCSKVNCSPVLSAT